MSAVVRRNAWEIKTSFYFLSPMKFLSNVLFISQFMDCFITARGKSKLKQPAYRSNEFQFIQRGVCKFIFPVNSRGGQCFVTAEVRHLMQRHATFKEFTLLVTFSSLSQQRNRHCLSYVVYVHQLYYVFMVIPYK